MRLWRRSKRWLSSLVWSVDLAQAASEDAGSHVCPTGVPARHTFRQLLEGAVAVLREGRIISSTRCDEMRQNEA
jgi:hypothetical protein